MQPFVINYVLLALCATYIPYQYIVVYGNINLFCQFYNGLDSIWTNNATCWDIEILARWYPMIFIYTNLLLFPYTLGKHRCNWNSIV